MNENKQTVLTDEEINSISTENETKGDDWYDALSRFKPADLMQFARAIESAVLSKLRAAGEPVAWRYQTPTGWHATTDAGKVLAIKEHHPIEACYAAPQASAEVRNAALEEAAQVAEHVNTGAELVRVAVARAIRALKSAPAALAATKGESNGCSYP